MPKRETIITPNRPVVCGPGQPNPGADLHVDHEIVAVNQPSASNSWALVNTHRCKHCGIEWDRESYYFTPPVVVEGDRGESG